MGWFSNKIGNWAVKTQAKELDQFIARLSAMDSEELGLVVAISTDRRHKLYELFGWDLLDPILVDAGDIAAAMKLNQLIRQVQKDNNMVVAAALMVWLHTLRAATAPDLRAKGRLLWGQLQRGFPHVFDAEAGFVAMGGPELNLDGYERFPEGLSPTPT